jgi:hypothetical protein
VAKTNEKYLSELIKNIERVSNIEYEDIESPIDLKLKSISKFLSFELYFVGGTLIILAKNFDVKRIKT